MVLIVDTQGNKAAECRVEADQMLVENGRIEEDETSSQKTQIH